MLSQKKKVGAVMSYLPLVLFLMVQVADGWLTYRGVSTLGIEAEGNPFLRPLLLLLGNAGGILYAKSLASLCGFVLHAAGVHEVLMGLTVLYIYVALLSWSVAFTNILTS